MSDANSIAELAAQTATDDEIDELRSRTMGLVDKMFSSAERTLAVGSPAERAAITKHVLPAILKELQTREENDELAELREAQAALMTDVRTMLLGSDNLAAPAPAPEAPTDSKPAPRKAPARKSPARKSPAKKAPARKRSS